MVVIALLAFFWPCYRAFLPIMINTNEGWNAFFADAAMGRMPLYPSLEKLITNNYPPLSFYVIGSFGKIVGDPIFAGRLLSLTAIFIITFFVGKIVRQFGGSLQAAVVGSSYFLATMCLSFRWYVGVNDPQLLAQAMMIAGFSLFLRAMGKNSDGVLAEVAAGDAKQGVVGAQQRSVYGNTRAASTDTTQLGASAVELCKNSTYWLPLLIMVLAGFFKHNIITLPVSAILGLVLWQRWRALRFSLFFAGTLAVMGLACCYGCYGIDFLHNFLTPRSWVFGKVIDDFHDLTNLLIGMILWFFIAFQTREKKVVQWMTLMIVVAFLVGLVQRLGSGVFVNAQFDLVIIISMAMGVGFQWLVNEKREFAPILWLLFLIGPFLFSPNLYSFTQIFSSSGRAAIKQEEQEMNQLIAEVRQSPVDVFCESYITYRAGKPFVVDAFNVEERIKAGKLPADVVEQMIRNGKLVGVKRAWLVGEE